MAVDWGRHGQCGLAVGCPSSAARYSMFIAIGIFLTTVFKLNILFYFYYIGTSKKMSKFQG